MKGEFDFIDSVRSVFPAPAGVKGIGDDCAVIPQDSGYDTLVSTDMLVEGIHFLLDDITPYQLGWKSAASNFSDIAAMGGEPAGFFLAVSFPKNLMDEWADGFMRGIQDISELYGVPLLGGDTTSALGPISICITVLGRAAKGASIFRSGARPGDLVCVTGTLGDSAAGLDAILSGAARTETVQRLISRHYQPYPRLKEALSLAQKGIVHAMMDISDGIGSDLRHIMRESGVGMEIDACAIPVSEDLEAYCNSFGKDVLDFAAAGGEDYELVFTIAPDTVDQLPVTATVIGRVTDNRKLIWRGSEKDYQGFTHFEKQ